MPSPLTQARDWGSFLQSMCTLNNSIVFVPSTMSHWTLFLRPSADYPQRRSHNFGKILRWLAFAEASAFLSVPANLGQSHSPETEIAYFSLCSEFPSTSWPRPLTGSGTWWRKRGRWRTVGTCSFRSFPTPWPPWDSTGHLVHNSCP